MARGQKTKATLEDTNPDGGATTGYETELWAMADALRGSMDAAEPFEEKMTRLVVELQAQQTEGARLDAAIADNLKALGFKEGKA